MSFVNRDRPLRCRGRKTDLGGSWWLCRVSRLAAIAVGFAVMAWSPLDAAVRPAVQADWNVEGEPKLIAS